MEINCTLSEERNASDAVQNDEGIVKAPIPEEFCAADGASQPSESVQVVFIRSLKRPILLMEVLVAILLVSITFSFLFYPQMAMLREQRKMVRSIELDHVVNLLFADFVERLYLNEINWDAILRGSEVEIGPELMERIGYAEPFSHRGTYRFEEVIHKPPEPQDFSLWHFKLHFNFVPVDLPRSADPQQIERKTLRYQYDLFIARDLRPEEPPPEEQAEQEDESEDT